MSTSIARGQMRSIGKAIDRTVLSKAWHLRCRTAVPPTAHNNLVSDNYAWLPHNTDPSLPTPPQYQDMPVTPLPNRKQFYDDYVTGCEANAGNERCCASNEQDRVDMSLAQPAVMNVSEMTTTAMMTTTTVNLMPGWVVRGQLNTGIVT